MAIRIFRQYPIINGFVQVPPNSEENRTKYIVGSSNLYGTTLTNIGTIDNTLTKEVTIPKNAKYLEFLAYNA